jgi:hypothetical protein
VRAHSSRFACQLIAANRPLTSRFVIPCCPLLSPRFRRVAAPARPALALERLRRTTQRCRFAVERAFDNLVRWGLGTTRTWAGRSRRRWSGARSCLASTWPPSVRRPSTSSRTSVPTAPGFGASCSWNASSGQRRTADAAAATSTADEPDPPAHRHCLLRRPPPQLGVGSVGGPGPQGTSRRCHGAELTATPILTTTPQSGTGSRSPRPPPARDAPRCGPS